MKKIYFVLLLTFSLSISKAQYVTIPDPNFVTFLTQNFPQCMSGNQMDTTCTAIETVSYLTCVGRGISNFTGVQYFSSVLNLNVSNNPLITLPLPPGLTYLDCSFCGIGSLPVLPATLTDLDCNDNNLQLLFGLPSNLRYLDCSNNSLTYLPSLPVLLIRLICHNNLITQLPSLNLGLYELDCSNNPLDSLPSLVSSLYYLSCSNNQLNSLPILPNGLAFLNCSENPLFTLPVLPDSLRSLGCRNNQLSFLPTLPSGLLQLYCSGNQLDSFPLLPSTLDYIDCSNNLFISLPQMPSSLQTLHCEDNQITTLSVLSNPLKKLYCSGNLLTSLPTLPSSLRELYCENNQLVSLPVLGDSLFFLVCAYNQLISLPELPDSMYYLYIHVNPGLSCLPKLNKIQYFSYSGTGIQCIPNMGNIYSASPALSSYPVCDIFNPNACDFYWNINGKVYNDVNGNCLNELNEYSLKNVKVNLYSTGTLIQQTVTNLAGEFKFAVDTGSYTIEIDTNYLPLIVNCPPTGVHSANLSILDSINFNINFGTRCKPGFDIGVENINRHSADLFPGATSEIFLKAGDISAFYGAHCANAISGSVDVNISGPVTYYSAIPGSLIPTITGNTLTYSINDFSLVNFETDFRFNVLTNTTAQSGDQVCFDVIVNPLSGDINTTNNTSRHCHTVVNSYDPNEKEVSPVGDISPNQEWLTYTIYFQNTGTAPAHDIYILDTLDANVDPASFTLLSYSHENLTQVIGNVVRFNFPNIYLPDSTNDEPNSHGYIQYKIKPVHGLVIGTDIFNTANIYFDLNPPITTNTTVNTVSNIVSVIEINSVIDFSVYPNPVKEEVWVAFNLQKSSQVKIEIYNSLGINVKSSSDMNHKTGDNEIVISTSGLSQGIYQLRLIVEGEMITRKIVKM